MRFLYALLPLVAMVAAEPLSLDELSSSDLTLTDINDINTDFGIFASASDSNVDLNEEYETEAAKRMMMKKNPFRYTSFHEGESESEYHKELPLGIEMAAVLKQLSRFDRSKLSADRLVHYEVNPDFDLDQSRSLNLKMTPIYNYEQSRLIRRSPIEKAKIKRIMIKLGKIGIKPVTVKQYLKLRRQGFISGVHSPVKTMLAIQQGVNIPNIQSESGLYPSNLGVNVGLGLGEGVGLGGWNVNEQPLRQPFRGVGTPFTSDNININDNVMNRGYMWNQPSSSASWSGLSTGVGVDSSNTLLNRESMIDTNTNVGVTNNREFRDVMSERLTSSPTIRNQGYIIPSVQLANELRDSGITISHTINNQPAIEATHLQSQLLKCEVINFNSPACTKLQEFSSSILKDVSTPSALHNSILNLTNQ